MPAEPADPSGAPSSATASPTTSPTADPEAALPAAPESAPNAAIFGAANEEVARLLRSENINYYSVFKIDQDHLSDLRKNYFKLSRIVHPDKCSHPDAAKAQAVVTQAYDTLSNPVKRKLYDSYATAADTEKPEGMSYAEWEAQQQVEIPKWLERILRIKGGGICLLIVLIPVLIILVILTLLLYILCLPIRCVCRCCGVGQEDEEEAAAAAAAAADAQTSGERDGASNV